MYQTLLQQQKELSVVANSRANNVQVMDKAEVPGAPILPNPRQVTGSPRILAGVTIAMGLAFGIEYLDDTVKTPEDITRGWSCRCSASCRRSAATACRC